MRFSHRLLLPALSLLAAALAGCGDADPSTSKGEGASGTTGGGGTGAGAGGGGTGGAGGSSTGGPIEAPNEQWTWVGFEDAFCANGSTTGIGVNLTDQSKDVVVYLMGGGACWDNLTCYVLQTAANIDSGYAEAQFQQDAQGLLTASLFDRSDPANPFRAMSYIFVPYCTGDVHAGSKVSEYNGMPTSHVGYQNLTAYLNRLVPTFPDAERVILSGSSAGGFGVGLNWQRVQEAFASARVYLLDDSGPPLPAPYLSDSLVSTWQGAWALDAALPPDCAECGTAMDAILTHYGQKMTNQRGALLSYTQDNVISQYLQITTAEFEEGLGVLTTTRIEGQPRFGYFYVGGSSHVLLGDPSISQNGVVLSEWLRQMIDDDPSWQSVQP
jgi:hypothetical protein